jgi:hypothetical protein
VKGLGSRGTGLKFRVRGVGMKGAGTNLRDKGLIGCRV